eukprot:gene31312-35344_t
MSPLIPVVLSGGSGSRLWPLSRSLRPKQFLGVTEDASLFQLTLQRLQGITADVMRPIVVANNDHRFLVGEQCREAGIEPLSILLEPVARNTAPAITVAALASQEGGDDPVLLVLPSDHTFANVPAFHHAVRVGLQAAEAGALVTFGMSVWAVSHQPQKAFYLLHMRAWELLAGAMLAVMPKVEWRASPPLAQAVSL